MFSGVGGFEVGIQKAIQGAKCIGYSEIDKWAIMVYRKHFPEHKNFGDATKIDTSELPEFDLLCAGFPCQAFSIAGKRRGFEDTRGTLFFEIARILKAKRPEIVFLENVKGLLNHKKGKTFAIILQTLDELGYDIQWMVLNSKFFGVPQNRERVFIIGSIRGTSRPKILPFKKTNEKTNQKRIIHPTITEAIGKQGCSKEYIKSCQLIFNINHSQNIYSTNGTSIALKGCGGGQGAKTGLYAIDLYNKKLHPDRTPALTEPHHNTLRILETKIYTDVSKKIKQRITNPNQEEIRQYLNKWRKKANITIKEIEKHFGDYKAHHWFEKNGSLPSVDDWIELKKILNFDDKYDKIMTTFRWTTEWELIQEHKERHKKRGNGFGFQIKIPNEQSNTLTSMQKGIDYNLISDKISIRRLTPIECERLQGFPDNWTKYGIDENGNEVLISDTQRYKMMGNAVTTNVVEAIARKLRMFWERGN